MIRQFFGEAAQLLWLPTCFLTRVFTHYPQKRLARSVVLILLCYTGVSLGPFKLAHAQNLASANGPVSPAGTNTSNAAIAPITIPTSQFVLGIADVIRINVWKNAELSQTVTVGPDGFVSLPLLGDVQVAGLTANQLSKALAIRVGLFVVNPEVTVSVVDIRSRQVFVLGQISKPGGYPLIASVNVLQLIAEAGGLTTYANRKAIVILRPSHVSTAKATTQRIKFNYNNVVGGDDKQNINLEPGDTVVVP